MVRWKERPPLDPPRSSMHLVRHVDVGAPIGVEIGEDWPSVRAYADRIEFARKDLDADVDKQIVWVDPATVLKKAAGGAGGDPFGGYGSDLAKVAKVMQERAAARGPEQTAKDLAWADRWARWEFEWAQWYKRVHSSSPGIPPKEAWLTQQAYEQRLRALHADFAKLGGTSPTAKLPETLESPTGKPDDAGDSRTKLLEKAVWVGGAIAVAWGVASVAKLVRG